jgi:hypothetical protein
MKKRKTRSLVLAIGCLVGMAAACGPKIEVKPIGTRVDPAPPPSTPAPAAAEKALPPKLPGGWALSGGPADYDAKTAPQALGDEMGRFRGLVSYASAEYTNLAQRVISLESFQLASAEAAAGAMSVGRPETAKAIEGNDLDGGFTAGLRAEARKGALLVRVKWFEGDDLPLADAAVEAMRDALEAGVASGLAGATPTPTPAPAPAPAATPAPAP